MLFAEVNDATWAAVAMSAVAMVGGAIALGVNATKERRMKRDAFEFDAQLVEIRSKHKECEEGHRAAAEKVRVLEVKLDECQETHVESAKDRERMWSEIEKLKRVATA